MAQNLDLKKAGGHLLGVQAVIGQRYVHAEAFCLMWYVCDCGHREVIWNSRDGVTPFGITCSSCGGMARHERFDLDSCQPDYKPRVGQKYFRDGTSEEAVKFMISRIERARAAGHVITPERAVDLVNHAERGDLNEFQPGWPVVVVKQPE